jgi:hypothetical protein
MSDGNNLSRRKFLTVAGVAAAGGVLAARNLISAETPVVAAPPALPWRYSKLDPLEAGRRGYKNYLEKGG